MNMTPVLNVVVYSDPGPTAATLEREALEYVIEKSPWRPAGSLGYVVLVAADFERLWQGVAAGDAVGTAAGILRCLGPQIQDLIGRPQEYVYSWLGDEASQYGRVLLLQVIPKTERRSNRKRRIATVIA